MNHACWAIIVFFHLIFAYSTILTPLISYFHKRILLSPYRTYLALVIKPPLPPPSNSGLPYRTYLALVTPHSHHLQIQVFLIEAT